MEFFKSIKNEFTLVNLTIVLFILISSIADREYKGIIALIFIVLLIPQGILYYINLKKEDKKNNTTLFKKIIKQRIIGVCILVIILIAFYFYINQKY